MIGYQESRMAAKSEKEMTKRRIMRRMCWAHPFLFPLEVGREAEPSLRNVHFVVERERIEEQRELKHTSSESVRGDLGILTKQNIAGKYSKILMFADSNSRRWSCIIRRSEMEKEPPRVMKRIGSTKNNTRNRNHRYTNRDQ